MAVVTLMNFAPGMDPPAYSINGAVCGDLLVTADPQPDGSYKITAETRCGEKTELGEAEGENYAERTLELARDKARELGGALGFSDLTGLF